VFYQTLTDLGYNFENILWRKILERTLILIKPDGVQRGLIGEIVGRFERRGLKLAGMKFLQVSQELAAQHYAEHEGKPFYPGLISYIQSGPVVAMVWEGPNAVALSRQLMGKTKPVDAEVGTIRADLAVDVGRNLVHGSDKPETGVREVALWFRAEELTSWARDTDRWAFEL
jgi:nucleoside-diphosphate kinase